MNSPATKVGHMVASVPEALARRDAALSEVDRLRTAANNEFQVTLDAITERFVPLYEAGRNAVAKLDRADQQPHRMGRVVLPESISWLRCNRPRVTNVVTEQGPNGSTWVGFQIEWKGIASLGIGSDKLVLPMSFLSLSTWEFTSEVRAMFQRSYMNRLVASELRAQAAEAKERHRELTERADRLSTVPAVDVKSMHHVVSEVIKKRPAPTVVQTITYP